MDKVKMSLNHIYAKIKRWGIHITILILLVILLNAIIFIIFPVILESLKINDELQEPRNFHVSFDGWYNRSPSVDPNMLVDLNITHSRKFLLVDEPVEISGTAILLTPETKEIQTIIIGFQNAQAYPIKQNEWGITQSGFIVLTNEAQNETQSITHQWEKLTGRNQIVWTLEGIYHPYFRTRIYTTDITNMPITLAGFTSTQDVSITVYPRTQLGQIINNKASFILASAVFILTLFGIIISIRYEFQYKSPDTNNYTYYEQEKTKTSNSKTNDTIINRDNVVDIHQEEQYGEGTSKG